MKFSQADRGKRAERTIKARFAGHDHTLILRPLSGLEETEVLVGARDYAKSKGAADAKPGDPLYEMGLAVHTLALGCLDVDSPADARTPFFDGGDKQILQELGREEIAYLYERHDLWQDECSPTISKLGGAELVFEVMRQVEAEDDGPFVRLRPGTRRALLRTLGALCLSSPELRSRLGALESPGSSPVASTH